MALKFAKLTFSFNLYIRSFNLPFFHIFEMNFDSDAEGILKNEMHFQLPVFHVDFKSAVKIVI